jgi:hypothetical protein
LASNQAPEESGFRAPNALRLVPVSRCCWALLLSLLAFGGSASQVQADSQVPTLGLNKNALAGGRTAWLTKPDGEPANLHSWAQ